MTARPTIDGEVAALRAELACLRQRVDRLERGGDDRLLAAIADAVGADLFTAAELIAHARLEEHAPLRRALLACGATEPKRLGRRLKRLGVECIGSDRTGRVWRLRI